MAIPNLKHIVQQVRDSQRWDFRTKAGLCAYSGAVVSALFAEDSNFKHLKKRVPKNGCYPPGSNDGRAVDAALYVPTGQAVDFIASAGFGDPFLDDDGHLVPYEKQNMVTWGTGDPLNKYGPEDGFDPTDVPPIPPHPPEPPTSNLEQRVAELESKVAALEADMAQQVADLDNLRQKMENMELDYGQRLSWLEHGHTGPQYKGTSRMFGGEVISNPIKTDIPPEA